jgi:signal transduction histidine kinase
MVAALVSPPPRGLLLIFGWRRLLVVVVLATLVGAVIGTAFPTTPTRIIVFRLMLVGVAGLMAFGLFERWPAKLPSFIARWALQVLAVAFVVPWTVLAIYLATTMPDQPPFWRDAMRLNGFLLTTMTALLVAPWTAVAALFRQQDFAARRQAMAFQLEKSELERKALDARLRLLQAQVEPHFLFNTLANVRELVDSGSPQASTVLDTLISYLRAAVPRLNENSTTLGQELQLVKAYLELMQMRMPDRLQFALQVDQEALSLKCPPTTLLTLVENAIRHGIDPSEEGGRITVCAKVENGRCCVQVRDDGVGLGESGSGLGTGLASLRERLQLVFGGNADLRLYSLDPPGTCAEVQFPAVSQ